VSSFPAKPNPPSKVEIESGETYITLEWTASSDTELPVIGYVLKMDDGYGGDYKIIYNGKNYPNVLRYTMTGLTTSLPYRFTISALNFNGFSEESNSVPYIICVKPKQFSAPTLSAVT